MQYGGVFDFEFGDVELLGALEHEVLVEVVVGVGPGEAVLEVVDEHDLQRTDIKPIQLIRLYLQISRVLLLNRLELIC